MLARTAWFVAVIAAAAVAPARADVALGPGALGATVRDPDGRAVDGALVTVDGPTTREATTSAAGVVTLDALPLGTYALRVRRAGFAPFASLVTLGAGRGAIAIVAVRVVPARASDLHDLDDGAGTPLDVAPRVGVALARDAALDVVPTRGGLGLAFAGASPNDTQLEIDGIPLPRGGASATALAERAGLGLARVAIARGPAVGGAVDLRTVDLDGARGTRGALGYDSTLGTFASAGATARVGGGAVVADVADGATFRSDALAARGALARGVTFDVVSDGTHATFDSGVARATIDAPAVAVGVRAAFGRATVSARTYASATHVDALGAVSDARLRGASFAFAVPVGADAVTFGYDRRGERDVARDGSVATRAATTLSADADLRLSETARLELSDAFARGTSVGARHDPSLALALRADTRTTLRVRAGSAYALAPDLFARDAGAVRPETAFGFGLGIDEALAGGGRSWLAVDDVRRFDRFAARADARALGVEIGVERPPAPGRIDGAFALRLERVRTFGAMQSPARAALASAPDAPSGAKAHLDLGFTGGATRASFGFTTLAGNLAYGARVTTLADARVRVRFANAVDATVGVANLFGAVARDPALAALLRPHELTLTIGPARLP